MPFGVESYSDFASLFTKKEDGNTSLQCLSAWSPTRTLDIVEEVLNPEPVFSAFRRGVLFGLCAIVKKSDWQKCVFSAFRRGVLFGR